MNGRKNTLFITEIGELKKEIARLNEELQQSNEDIRNKDQMLRGIQRKFHK